MMTKRTPAPTWANELAHEHAHLGNMLLRVRRLLSASIDVSPVQSLVILLDQVTVEVREHMAFEEQGGYLAPVAQRLPGRHNTVEQLLGEHALLQSGLADVLAQLRECSNLFEFRETISPRLDRWIDRMRDHERRENLLVQEAFNTDISACD